MLKIVHIVLYFSICMEPNLNKSIKIGHTQNLFILSSVSAFEGRPILKKICLIGPSSKFLHIIFCFSICVEPNLNKSVKLGHAQIWLYRPQHQHMYRAQFKQICQIGPYSKFVHIVLCFSMCMEPNLNKPDQLGHAHNCSSNSQLQHVYETQFKQICQIGPCSKLFILSSASACVWSPI